MAANVSSILKTAALETSRDISWHLLVDWNDDGFASQATWTDESANIITVEGSMESVNWRSSLTAVGDSVVNSVTVSLHNALSGANRRYWLANPNGTLFSSIGNGAIKFKRATLKVGFYRGGVTYYCPMLTGYITNAREMRYGKVVEFTIQDRAIDAGLTTVSTDLYTSVFPYTYVANLINCLSRDKLAWLSQGGWGAAYVDAGFFPLLYAWADEDNLWTELCQMAASQMGRVYFDRAGDFHFEDASHWVRPRSQNRLNPLISQATISADDYNDCQPLYDIENHYSRIVVNYTSRYPGPEQVIYSTPDVWMVPPGSSNTFYATFRHPVMDVVTPVVNTDYSVVTAGGIDLSASVTVTFTFSATEAKIAVVNGSATYAAIVTGMTIRGTPSLPRQQAKYETTAAGAVHETTWTITNPYIQHHRHAQAIGDFALARTDGHVSALQLTGVRGMPWLEVGDRITVTGDNLDPLHTDYFLVRIHFTGPIPFQMTLEAIRVDDLYQIAGVPITDFFFCGDGTYTASKYGGEIVTGHGHLFY